MPRTCSCRNNACAPCSHHHALGSRLCSGEEKGAGQSGWLHPRGPRAQGTVSLLLLCRLISEQHINTFQLRPWLILRAINTDAASLRRNVSAAFHPSPLTEHTPGCRDAHRQAGAGRTMPSLRLGGMVPVASHSVTAQSSLFMLADSFIKMHGLCSRICAFMK